MTDKEKIRKEVERLFNHVKDSSFESDSGAFYYLKDLLDFIDSMQEEPVSIDFEQELYKAFGQVKDFTLGMRIAKRFYEMGRNHQEPVSEDLEEAVKNRDEYKEWQGSPDIQKELIDFAKFGNQYKEPVSEDLEEAAVLQPLSLKTVLLLV